MNVSALILKVGLPKIGLGLFDVWIVIHDLGLLLS
jgi:hypothetical protein